MESPVQLDQGLSIQRERRWGLIGGLAGAVVGIGSCVVALLQGESVRDMSGSPWPAVLNRRELMPLDFCYLALVVTGLVFGASAAWFARRSSFPRSDAFGAALAGGILSALGGIVLFIRVYAMAVP